MQSKRVPSYIINKYQSFIRFILVGIVNTFNYYILYLLFMAVSIPYIFSHTVAFVISMIGSFYLNCYFTYKTKPTLKKFFQFPITYIVNYSVTTISLYVLVDLFMLNEFIAPLISAVIPIPFTYLVSRWVLTK
ncbi:GtrA family protein [Paucisalibacillus globulus]|uniref:GtrA family protein n=1 Tax=Paucisalibacillus globulus TaxID=351095 RepID=UPI0006859C98|nr:GtrA family protein [Paucisalibacillus globulus]